MPVNIIQISVDADKGSATFAVPFQHKGPVGKPTVVTMFTLAKANFGTPDGDVTIMMKMSEGTNSINRTTMEEHKDVGVKRGVISLCGFINHTGPLYSTDRMSFTINDFVLYFGESFIADSSSRC